ncbi:MAG TPA: glucose-6-phosphate dehydrogenase assembly protein OpcA [Candidatus Eisenbacteria bacterium]|nr:glucose-6-phosphate dehydrogenase assembly protein OpcA [Candidatus Eisenbacteria bacterium]
MDHALVPLGNTVPHALDLAKLRSDLSTLWREEGRGVSRACHATLVVVVSPGEDPQSLLDDLVLTHPSRVLRIEHDPKLPQTEVVAWASGCCMKRPSGTLVCSETIHFMVGEDAGRRLPSVIRSLTVGGVPLVVISREISPLGLSWVAELEGDVDSVVGRSAALTFREGLELWEAWTHEGRRPPVQDLTWDELDPWRGIIQSRFDRAREVSRLASLSEVRLESGPGPGHWLEMALLAGWLGSRLRWTEPRKIEGGRWSVRRAGGETAIVFERHPEAAGLQQVTFAFDDRSEPIRWGKDALPVETPSAPLSRGLHRHDPDPVAWGACRFALELAEAEGIAR